jgi:hypothetical protein
VNLNAPDLDLYDWPEWYHVALVDLERDDVWVPAYFLAPDEAEGLLATGHLFWVESDNAMVDGKPFASSLAVISLRGGCPILDAHRLEVLSKFWPDTRLSPSRADRSRGPRLATV